MRYNRNTSLRATATKATARILATLNPRIEASQRLIFANRRVRRLDQQEPQQPVALLRDVAETLGIAAGMFLRIQTAVGRDAASLIETLDRIQRVHHRQPSQKPYPRMRPQPHHTCILLRSHFQLLFDGVDSFFQRFQQRERMLALGSVRSLERQHRELLLAASSEQPRPKPQLMTQRHGLQPIPQHRANPYQPVTVTQ
jgi:hypothetical protein